MLRCFLFPMAFLCYYVSVCSVSHFTWGFFVELTFPILIFFSFICILFFFAVVLSVISVFFVMQFVPSSFFSFAFVHQTLYHSLICAFLVLFLFILQLIIFLSFKIHVY